MIYQSVLKSIQNGVAFPELTFKSKNEVQMTVEMTRDQRFVEMIEGHKGLIYKVAASYESQNENKRDLVQDIVLQLWRSFDRYDSSFKASTWIYRVALNVAISNYRKKKSRVRTVEEAETLFNDSRLDDMTDEDENIRLLMNYIAELKEIDRALVLMYLDGKDQSEIGEVLGLSTTNVSTRMYRIKKQLQSKFHNNKSLS